jgi:energy-coupling factor transporter transmembrane protein EcfT
MQDVRLRTGVAILLSIAAFFSIAGAFAAAAWCLIFARKLPLGKNARLFLSLAAMMGFFSLVLEVSGGDGVSYFIRMMVIVLIGVWVYSEQKKGEFLRLGVWLLGDRAGFELGLLADMAVQAMDLLIADFKKIRIAERLKQRPLNAARIVPAGVVLVHNALRRADDTAELLAVRGYRNGGSLCPAFATTYRDVAASLLACIVALLAIIPVSEFFILYR